MQSGYRRRILIEPSPNQVTAELEDDYHRMVVTLAHRDGVITEVASQMKRWPWTTCPGAMGELADTFTGVALIDCARRGERLRNCTHLHDLTLFAAAHAAETAPIAYEIFVSDAADGRREARLSRDGAQVFAWSFQDGRITQPEVLAGRTLSELGDWIASLDRRSAEAARILRWAAIVAQGRGMDIPAGITAGTFRGGGACYTFHPDRADHGQRVGAAHMDFSAPGREPMADRSDAFKAPVGVAQA